MCYSLCFLHVIVLLKCVFSKGVCFSDRCACVVEKFLSLDLDDKSVDLQAFLKDELLPSGGGLL